MKAEEFTAWRNRLGLKKTEAADVLGLSRNMPQRYEDGIAEIPLYIALACAAVAHGIPPIGSAVVTNEGTLRPT